MIAIEPLPARIRCTACDAETSSTLLELAPTTMGWVLLEGHWFCSTHAPAAPWIVQLDRERNAHQVTMLRLDEMRRSLVLERRCGELAATMSDVHRAADLAEAAATYEAMRAELEALRPWCCLQLDAFSDGELEPALAEAFRMHLATCGRCAAVLHGRMQEIVTTGADHA